MDIKKIPLKVFFAGENKKVEINPRATIWDLKVEIAEQIHFPADQIRLKLYGILSYIVYWL